MDTALFMLVALLFSGLALAFYMDWLGLWVSKDEMREQIERGKEGKHALSIRLEAEALETGALGRDAARLPACGKAVAFDWDGASLKGLREALPGSAIGAVNGTAAASRSRDWNFSEADLFVVKAQIDAAGTLGLCRFLSSCPDYSRDSCKDVAEIPGLYRSGQNREVYAEAPFLVLVALEQKALVEFALEAGDQQMPHGAHPGQGSGRHVASDTCGQSASPAHSQLQ